VKPGSAPAGSRAGSGRTASGSTCSIWADAKAEVDPFADLDLPDAPPKPKAPTEATPTTLVAARGM
jgi:hypothetical protein